MNADDVPQTHANLGWVLEGRGYEIAKIAEIAKEC
jgi:hypothetical protein